MSFNLAPDASASAYHDKMCSRLSCMSLGEQSSNKRIMMTKSRCNQDVEAISQQLFLTELDGKIDLYRYDSAHQFVLDRDNNSSTLMHTATHKEKDSLYLKQEEYKSKQMDAKENIKAKSRRRSRISRFFGKAKVASAKVKNDLLSQVQPNAMRSQIDREMESKSCQREKKLAKQKELERRKSEYFALNKQYMQTMTPKNTTVIYKEPEVYASSHSISKDKGKHFKRGKSNDAIGFGSASNLTSTNTDMQKSQYYYDMELAHRERASTLSKQAELELQRSLYFAMSSLTSTEIEQGEQSSKKDMKATSKSQYYAHMEKMLRKRAAKLSKQAELDGQKAVYFSLKREGIKCPNKLTIATMAMEKAAFENSKQIHQAQRRQYNTKGEVRYLDRKDQMSKPPLYPRAIPVNVKREPEPSNKKQAKLFYSKRS